jgi:hypothetical protein
VRRSLVGAGRRGGGLLGLAGLFLVVPLSAAQKAGEIRDASMRRIVAEVEGAAARVPRQFQTGLARAAAKCGKDCDREALVQAVVKAARSAEQKLTAAIQAADRQLKERARSVKGPDGVLGAPGDLSRSVARLEMTASHASGEMTEAIAALGEAGFGGEPLLTTLELRLASLLYITPIDWRVIFTARSPGTSTGSAYIDGSAPANAPVTVTLTCGGVAQTLKTVTNSEGRWSMTFTATVSGPTTCTATATAGTGINAGSMTFEVHFL